MVRSTGASVAGPSELILSEIAYSPYWLRLLHFEKSVWGGYRSRLDGGEFFFSPHGQRDPLAELKSDLIAFKENRQVGRLKQHPQCAFPERFRFLKEKLNLKIPEVSCPKLKEYLERFHPESVTLVFSSAYPHNPGSMFGHTFLRVNSKNKNLNQQDLLDWGISYAAQVSDDENGFAFVFLGLTGGYRGQFSLLPYYAKVNEYVNNESRDLWEYELDLNEEETFRLLRNIWEVETNSYFNYYFLDENCSYQLLAFLEVAKPDWNLTDFSIYVIPGETIKKIAKIPGAIRSIQYRPSLQKKMMKHYSLLNETERNQFENTISFRLSPKEVLSSKVLDQVAEYLLYLKKKQENSLSDEHNRLLRLALLQRSHLGIAKTDTENVFPVTESSRPDLAHDTYRLSFASGLENKRWGDFQTQMFHEVQFKFAFHDLLNNDQGYTPFSQLDFPSVTLRYYDKSDFFRLENLHFLSLTSLSPLKNIEKYPSWAFHLERSSPKDISCDHCQVVHFDLGAGATLGMGEHTAVFYSLLFFQTEIGNSFRLGYRVLPKWQVGSIVKPLEPYKIQWVVNSVWDVFQSDRRKQFWEIQMNQSVALGRSWELRLITQGIVSGASTPSFYEGKVALNYYF